MRKYTLRQAIVLLGIRRWGRNKNTGSDVYITCFPFLKCVILLIKIDNI